MVKPILSVVLLVAGAGGATVLRARPPSPPAHVRAVQLSATSGPDLQGAVTGVVEAIAPGVITLQASPAALPARVAATTTGGPLVDAVLPLASGVQIYGTPGVGAHVAVVLSNGSVTTVAVLPAPASPPAVKPLPAKAAPRAVPPSRPWHLAAQRPDRPHPQAGRHLGRRGR